MLTHDFGSGVGAQLRAYDPIPVDGEPVLRWSAPVGQSAKFALPGVGAGRLYVGTRDEHVLGFGSPVTPPISGGRTEFPLTKVGSTATKTLTSARALIDAGLAPPQRLAALERVAARYAVSLTPDVV